jgi:hypothetical protein
VYEGFSALLSDPYVIVHRAAVRALDRFELPSNFNAVAKRKLASIIEHYAKERNEDEFLMETIDLYANRYAKEEQLADRLGKTLLGIIKTLRPYSVAREIRSLGRLFSKNASYPSLLFRLIADDEAMSLYHEDLLEELGRLRRQAFHQERHQILALGKAISKRYRHSIGVLIEGLTASGAWQEAAELTAEIYREIEDTTRNRPMRLHAALQMIACSYEAAIASSQPEKLPDLRNQWSLTLTEIENDRAANKVRRDPLYGLRPSY